MTRSQLYRKLRRERGTQTAVADLLGVHSLTISRRERGEIEIPDEALLALKSLPKLASAPIYSTAKRRPPAQCWLWHSEDREWFWTRDTARMDFVGYAYNHLTHWSAGTKDNHGAHCAPTSIP